jgi:integral membrane protein (TIGR01906 family)
MDKISLHRIVTLLLVLLIISTSVMIYLSNLKSVAFDRDFYNSKFDEFGIHELFSEDIDVEQEADIMLQYLEGGKAEIESDFYNSKEKSHLVEVKHLFILVDRMLNIAVLVSIISLFLLIIAIKRFTLRLNERKSLAYFKHILSNLLIGIGFVVDGIAVFFVLIAFTFSSAFWRFHEIFFKTDTWILNPATDNLIRMMPEQFFFDAFTRIILMSIIFATILMAIGFAMKLIKQKK